MPLIQIDGPILDKEKKANLIKALTDAASTTLGLPAQAFTVIIRETPPDNVGIGGTQLSELHK
ncbi:MAG: 4-oxalocrotonate tautomerase [Bacillota bacterium]|nr:4-oxalocrotonate tautomerase [Bacillota bacterium]MDK2925612.1 4-oxalocrotonate tautomerase [Bacillota bacterium]